MKFYNFLGVISVFIILTLHETAARRINFFRKDYTYLESTDSFYKFHTIGKSWNDAKSTCEVEGSSLFYPEDQNEADVVLEFWNKTYPVDYIYVGISDSLAKGVYETIDGFPIEDVYNRWRAGEPNDANGVEDCVVLDRRDACLNDDRCDKRFNFICKKTQVSVEWDTVCDLPYSGYTYNETLGRCYKFHLTAKNWSDAHAVCRAEQSYLAIINSQQEADLLVNITASADKDKGVNLNMAGAVYLGFHNLRDEGWKTIRGMTLEESGYNKWSYGQPDGKGAEKCGSMFYDGELNDMLCSYRCFFICEHEIALLSAAIEDRFDNTISY